MTPQLQSHPGIEDKIDVVDAQLVSNAFKILKKHKSGIKNGVLSGSLAFKIYDSVGLKGDTLKSICDIYGIKYDHQAFQDEMERVKLSSKISAMVRDLKQFKSSNTHEKTDDSLKHKYEKVDKQNYRFPLVQTTVSEIVNLKDDFKAVLLPKTCCYGEAGGQIGDSGKISNMDGQTMFQIKDTQLDHKNGYVWHIGSITKLFYQIVSVQCRKIANILFY